MKNLIITWFHYENYGTNLQAYALQKFLNNGNKETQILNYIQDIEEKDIIKKRENKKIYDIIKNKKNNFIRKKINKIYAKELIKKSEKFKNFRDKNIQITEKYSRKNLEKLNKKYDNFIAGSDQIWNPKSDYTAFLDFVNEDRNKIAYAPSFGVGYLTENRKEEIKKFINRFNYLSAREYDGKKIIEEITNRKAQIVLDPTLLLTKEEWLKICESKKQNNKKYILCYFLGDRNYYWKYVNKVKKETGYSVKIIPIQPMSFLRKDKLEIDVGPKEFIELINDAEIVITDSYHGIIFSMIFEKNFSVLKRFKDKDKMSQNSRIYTLLKTMNLEKHLIEENSKDIIYIVDDYDNTRKILNKEKEKSIKYLTKAINKK